MEYKVSSLLEYSRVVVFPPSVSKIDGCLVFIILGMLEEQILISEGPRMKLKLLRCCKHYTNPPLMPQ